MSDLDNNNGPDENEGGNGDPKEKETDDKAFSPITVTSQEQFDELVRNRLDRLEKKHARELSKYEGFEDIKAKAEKFDAFEAEQGTEIEKLTRRIEKAERERDEFKTKIAKSERNEMVRDIADELGLPKALVKRVQGDTEDDIRADIADLMQGLPSPKKNDDEDAPKDKEPPSRAPKPKMTFTATGDESDEGLEMSADEILKQVPRGGGQR